MSVFVDQQNVATRETPRQRPSILAMEREVCASLARGNISLQRGEYITADDIDRLQDDLVRYFATEESVWQP